MPRRGRRIDVPPVSGAGNLHQGAALESERDGPPNESLRRRYVLHARPGREVHAERGTPDGRADGSPLSKRHNGPPTPFLRGPYGESPGYRVYDPGRKAPKNWLGPVENPKQKSPSVEYWKGASMMKIKRPREHQPRQGAGGKKEAITEFSSKARRNLREHLHRVRDDAWAGALFVTLTYPREFPSAEDWEVYKGHRRAFEKRAKRIWPKFCGFWKVEFQEREAAHFHNIVFGIEGDEVGHFQTWALEAWYEIVGSEDEKHLYEQRGVVVEYPKHVGSVRHYLANYVSKSGQELPGRFTGRYWGAAFAQDLPYGERVELQLTPDQALRFHRTARKWLTVSVWAQRWQTLADQVNKKFGWSDSSAPCALTGDTLRSVFSLRVTKAFGPECTVREGQALLIQSVPAKNGEPGLFRPPRRYRCLQNDTLSLLGPVERLLPQLLKLSGYVSPSPAPVPPPRPLRKHRGRLLALAESS